MDKMNTWIIYIDGLSCELRSGAGIVLEGLKR